jgi:hypothetical protein
MSEHVIELTYKSKPIVGKHTVGGSGSADDGEYGDGNYEVMPSKKVFQVLQVGDTLEFRSDQGYVTVKLEPKDMFAPHIFSTDPVYCENNKEWIKLGGPVKVIKEPGKKGFKYCCGFSVGYPGNDRLGVPEGGPT